MAPDGYTQELTVAIKFLTTKISELIDKIEILKDNIKSQNEK
jgi:hypothetical protein